MYAAYHAIFTQKCYLGRYLFTYCGMHIHSFQNKFGRQSCYMCVVRGVTYTHNPMYWLRITAKNIYGTEIGLDMPCQNYLTISLYSIEPSIQ